MEREDYLILRKNNQINLEFTYEYYNIMNRDENKKYSIEEFAQLFQAYVNMLGINLVKIYEYFDAKFFITRVINNKTGEIIMFL